MCLLDNNPVHKDDKNHLNIFGIKTPIYTILSIHFSERIMSTYQRDPHQLWDLEEDEESIYNRLGYQPTKRYVVAGSKVMKGKKIIMNIFVTSLKWVFYTSRMYLWPRYRTMMRCTEAASNEEEPDDSWHLYPLHRIYDESGELKL